MFQPGKEQTVTASRPINVVNKNKNATRRPVRLADKTPAPTPETRNSFLDSSSLSASPIPDSLFHPRTYSIAEDDEAEEDELDDVFPMSSPLRVPSSQRERCASPSDSFSYHGSPSPSPFPLTPGSPYHPTPANSYAPPSFLDSRRTSIPFAEFTTGSFDRDHSSILGSTPIDNSHLRCLSPETKSNIITAALGSSLPDLDGMSMSRSSSTISSPDDSAASTPSSSSRNLSLTSAIQSIPSSSAN